MANERDRAPELTNRLLIAVAGTISAQWEKFTAWLVTGLAATLALIIANLDKAKDMLEPASLSYAIKIFVAILLMHTVQRVLAIAVASGVDQMANPAIKDLQPPITPTESAALLANIEAAYFPPFSWMIRGAFRKIRQGELIHIGTRVVRLSLTGTLLAVVQVGLALWLVWVIAKGLA